MPKYNYKCSQCNSAITIYHSINDLETDCTLCDSESSLERVPSTFILFEKERSSRVGNVVKRSIEDFREDLNEEKQRLKNELFDTNE